MHDMANAFPSVSQEAIARSTNPHLKPVDVELFADRRVASIATLNLAGDGELHLLAGSGLFMGWEQPGHV